MGKYKLTEESMEYKGRVLRRIEDIETQEKGGWIENEANLSQSGKAWIAGEAKVYEQASISGSAYVGGEAEVFGFAKVSGNATIVGNAKVYEKAVVQDYATVAEQASVYGNACLEGAEIVLGNEHVEKIVYTWNDINRIDSIHLSIGFSNNPEEVLYANGRHQIMIQVNIVARNKENQIIVVSPQEVFENILFVDYKNSPVGTWFDVSDTGGEYVYPDGGRKDRRSNTSLGIFYLSTTEVLGSLKLCVKCIVNQKVNTSGQEDVKQVEYSTALIGGNGVVSAVDLTVTKERLFNNSDIYMSEIEPDKKAGEYRNSLLHKFYFRFSARDLTITKKAVCEEGEWFYYKQNGNYKAFATSTDSSVALNPTAQYKARFVITDKWKVELISTNHEEVGLCFWIYRIWHGALWSYRTWENVMLFSLFDQYGNEARIQVSMNGETKLNYTVL